MSKLNLSGRQWVEFNSEDENHRRWYGEFKKLKTWSKCPVRFIVSDNYTDVVQMIHEKLLDHYINKEFEFAT